jgi:hypothetical protein
MMTDDERLYREKAAVSVEWGLNLPQPGSGVAEDAYLAPEAAEIVLKAMVADYTWLGEWVELARNAALAAVTVEVAQANGAPRLLQIALSQTAEEARAKLERMDVPNGVDARQVLECFAKLQRVAARKPDVYL